MSDFPARAWVVMHPQRFADLDMTFLGSPVPVAAPANGSPLWYLPVFETRELAVAWNGGEDGVAELQRGDPPKVGPAVV